jgi:NADH:ubiquinone oxidoreductase subunit 6 (subunit J)
MNDILVIIIILAVYLVGVFVSMIMVAYINRKGEELPEPVSMLSWCFVLTILLSPIIYMMIWPFEKFQKYLNNKFKEK